MKQHYVSICSTFEDVQTYGIAFVQKQNGRYVITESYIDLCADNKKVDNLVNTCNDLKLDPIHLQDIVADFLTEL